MVSNGFRPAVWGRSALAVLITLSLSPSATSQAQPLPNWDYDTNTYTSPTYTDTTPTDYTQLHLPGPVDVVAPIIAPRDTLRIGTFHIAQPNWVSDIDLERTNNTTAIIESGVATGWNSFWRITLPAIAPALASGALFAFAASFDDVVIALLIAASCVLALGQGLRYVIDAG